VIGGGFHPDEITPRPPLLVIPRSGGRCLEWNASAGGTGERTILGGLKTKAVDVVVTKEGIGPVLAISMKGTLNAFRNLTNRMERRSETARTFTSPILRWFTASFMSSEPIVSGPAFLPMT
jgi:hypothetical protein